MILPTEPAKHETSIARAARLKRESAARGVHKSKADIEAEEKQATAANLARPIDASNKGFKMLERMGFKAGGGLGRDRSESKGKDETLREPIRVKMREGRIGIGGEEEPKKRKRDGSDSVENNKIPKQDPEDFRRQRAQDAESSRNERRLFAAQKTAIRLEEQQAEKEAFDWTKRPLGKVAVVIREMVKKEREVEAERARQRDENKQAGEKAKKAVFDDSDDSEYRHAFGLEVQGLRKLADVEEEDDDAEVQEFNEATPDERLQRSVDFLRNEHLYCFWCRVKYEDDGDLRKNCPGPREEDHEELDE